ncbi:hypothetical protein CFP56_041613 [Quercus suber]|uniref:Uncharacterized protein n=1 Tax=Quercus suber TaxID=58331 RepID=A0AAW0IUB4_QUESU
MEDVKWHNNEWVGRLPVGSRWQHNTSWSGLTRLRYVPTPTTTSSNGNEETMVKWAKENPLMIDPIKPCLINNLKRILSPINDDGKNGCKIEWSFVRDPIEGLRFEDFLPYIETGLHVLLALAHHMACRAYSYTGIAKLQGSTLVEWPYQGESPRALAYTVSTFHTWIYTWVVMNPSLVFFYY